MKTNNHVVLCIMGRTASGKDSLVSKLCEHTGLKQVISYTTRERRNGEGDTHHFVTETEYEAMKSNNKIAAYTKIGDYRYWSTTDQLYDNDVYIIDPIGVKSLRELDLPNIRFVTVYINVPDDIREERALNQRGDEKTKFRVRDFNERQQFREMLQKADFDYAVQNIRFPEAYSCLRWISIIEGVWKNDKCEE